MPGENKSFEIFEIDHETGEICLALRRDLAELIAQSLVHLFKDVNPCVFALGVQILTANDILLGRRKIDEVNDFGDCEVKGEPPASPLPMVTRPVFVPIRTRSNGYESQQRERPPHRGRPRSFNR